MSATPRPWRVESEEIDGELRVMEIIGPNEECIVETDHGSYPPELDDAHLIVTAVNAFKELLAVAKALVKPDEHGDARENVSSALDALDAAHPGWREWTP